MNKHLLKPLPPLEDGGEEIVKGIIDSLNFLAIESKKLGLYFSAHLINVASDGVKMDFKETKRLASKNLEVTQ